MEVKLSESLTIEIVTSKVDKKYDDEQGGTGESRKRLAVYSDTLK